MALSVFPNTKYLDPPSMVLLCEFQYFIIPAPPPPEAKSVQWIKTIRISIWSTWFVFHSFWWKNKPWISHEWHTEIQNSVQTHYHVNTIQFTACTTQDKYGTAKSAWHHHVIIILWCSHNTSIHDRAYWLTHSMPWASVCLQMSLWMQSPWIPSLPDLPSVHSHQRNSFDWNYH